MQSDEQQIRELVRRWLAATQQADVDQVLQLMTDDVVFLTSGRAPMDKQEFATLARGQGGVAPRMEFDSQIQEIQVVDNWAFMWTSLSVTIKSEGPSPPVVRSGHTLTVLKKEQGQWLVARDANLLSARQ